LSEWTPVSADALADRLAGWLASTSGLLRVAIDGPPCAHPERLSIGLLEPLRTLGRPAVHIEAAGFWRDASLRFEHGREDLESYRSWLDAGALRREVLDAALTSASYLPSLRDPHTNRSTREVPRRVEPGTVVIVNGAFLLGQDLPFDRTVHLAQSPATRARHTPADDGWTLPAFDAYDDEVRPAEVADAVVKLDDPRHPAVRWI
jgi:hypothetical protein